MDIHTHIHRNLVFIKKHTVLVLAPAKLSLLLPRKVSSVQSYYQLLLE